MDEGSEAERAAFYEAHKDDAAVWGDAEARDQPRRQTRLRLTVTIHFSPEEADRVRELAQRSHQSYPDVIRAAIRAYAAPAPRQRRVLGREEWVVVAGTLLGCYGWVTWEFIHHPTPVGLFVAALLGAFVGNAFIKFVIVIGVLFGRWH